ncbi:homoserine O-acetyltransferase [Rhizoctonia solani AG-1 IB]|uniref:Homoserine O-acetyltransferase n=1 Tax=Thanatephorus cucumeris (strain AG1-IB / isolate 7/3/14) TaxID=1108050 RepID=M5BHR6_THACB|nr:homoserine O-acetyltransferase [Rhizoctonia solani AG-1 IB]
MDKNTGTPYTHLVDNQNYEIIPSFDLECGRVLRDVPVAYKTFGKLNAERDNVMIICHAFTGSADVEDWWGPLVGHGKAFDPHRFFIFCGNVLGSPYGSASPLTIDPETREPYGPEFPITTIRDDVRIHKLVLDKLGPDTVHGASHGGKPKGKASTPIRYMRMVTMPNAVKSPRMDSRQHAWRLF